MTVRILEGDCRDVMRALPDASVDSIVTDPPYELGFMGKKWDGTGIANDVGMWREALRVLKPGGHLLAFSGSRTYHRMVCAIEDAGFEIRDQLMWLYGSGFPKSLDVSKAIDKRGGNSHRTAEIGAAIKAARLARGVSVGAADVRYCGGTTLWTWYEGRPAGQQLPTAAVMEFIAADWPELREHAKAIAEAEREVVGQRDGARLAVAPGQGSDRGDRVLDLTAASTDAACQWQGWGTALKPAHEPIVMARKPLVGTVAANVLAHGTGAINVDGCRIEGMKPDTTRGASSKASSMVGTLGAQGRIVDDGRGRWPANVLHDGSDEVVAAFYGQPDGSMNGAGGAWGGRARFFYTAKASRFDRNDGCDDLAAPGGTVRAAGGAQHVGAAKLARNHHPTVKPTDLMRWLVRLVTPPGGTVLDPFMGSGSTLKAAELEQFKAIGIELDPDYIAIARRRIGSDVPLFAQVA